MNALNRANSGKPAGEPPDEAAGQPLVIPVISEQLQVGTAREHTGIVRVRKVVHQVSQPLQAEGYREVVETVRVPVNQVVQAAREPWRQGEVLVVPVCEERLVRQLVLVEEIHVRRRREPCRDSASASLRREQAIVERLDPQTRQWLPEER